MKFLNTRLIAVCLGFVVLVLAAFIGVQFLVHSVSPVTGYAVAPVSTSSCPTGQYCLNDCDDGNPRIYPGAPEYCDGLDNNCDGLVDEACLQTSVTIDGAVENFVLFFQGVVAALP